MLIGVVTGFITALPFAITAFVLRRARVRLPHAVAGVSMALFLLLIALTDFGTQHWVRTVAFRFVSTVIMLTPLFALGWWLGGLGRCGPAARQDRQARSDNGLHS